MPYKPTYTSKKPKYQHTQTPPDPDPDTQDAYVFFWKPYAPNGWLCQWYQSPMTDSAGRTWTCCEQYYMWHKAALFDDTAAMARIRAEASPARQKALGRQVVGFEADKWEAVKYAVIKDANRLKFRQCYARRDDTCVVPGGGERDEAAVDVPLKQLLLGTGSRLLVEASPFDRLCGIGYKAEDALTVPREQWGENLLGKALMEIREELRSDDQGNEM